MYVPIRVLAAFVIGCALASAALADEGDDQFAAAANQYSAQHWDAAIEGFRNFVREYPGHAKHAKAMYYQGEALVQAGRFAEAYPLFIDLLADQPTGPFAKQALFRAAEAALKCGKTNDAKVRLSQFQDTYPDDKLNSFVLMYQSDSAMQAGDAATAAQGYRDSIERFGDQPTADQCRIGLAQALMAQKQFDSGDAVLHDVAQRNHSPWSEMALLQLAEEAFRARRVQESFDICDSVIQHFPSSPMVAQARLGRGRAAYLLNKFDDAQRDLAAAASDRQIGNEARHWLAQAQKAQKQSAAQSETLNIAAQADRAIAGDSSAKAFSLAQPSDAPNVADSSRRASPAKPSDGKAVDLTSVLKQPVLVPDTDRLTTDFAGDYEAGAGAGQPKLSQPPADALAIESAKSRPAAPQRVAPEPAVARRPAPEKIGIDKLPGDSVVAGPAAKPDTTLSTPAEASPSVQKEATVKAAVDKAGNQKVEASKAATPKMVVNSSAPDKFSDRRAAAQKLAADMLAADQSAGERADEQAAADQLASQQRAAERAAADQLALQRTAEKSAADQLAAQRAAAEKAAADQLAAQQAAAETAAAEKVATEKMVAERLAAERQLASAEQQRRQAAVLRFQEAQAMIRAGDFNRAAAILKSADNTAEDPASLADRYLLAVALQGLTRNDESLAQLQDLSMVIDNKLAATADQLQSESAAPGLLLSAEDLVALQALRGNVLLAQGMSLVAEKRYAEAVQPLEAYIATGRQDIGTDRAAPLWPCAWCMPIAWMKAVTCSKI